MRCGMVSIVGRPNVGKSTLINRLVGEKIAIVSNVPQTTRHQIRGIYNDERGQIVFIDTPGWHLGRDGLDRYMNQASVGSTDQVDCIIHLVDASEHVGREEHNVVDQLKDSKIPIILGLNKADLKGHFIPDYIALWEKTRGVPANEIEDVTFLPLSGKTGIHEDKLLEILFNLLPESEPLYPMDVITDTPQAIAIADIIREKLLHIMNDEVPHSIAVTIEHMERTKNKTMHIQALILVERNSQKEIVIGKGGQILKEVGTKARKELQDLLSSKIFLEFHVKTKKNWRDNSSLLQEMGYFF